MSQAGVINVAGGGGGGGAGTITGNTGGPLPQTANNWNIISNFSTIVFDGSGSTLSLNFITPTADIGIGTLMASLAGGFLNIGIGVNALQQVVLGSNNVAIGSQSMQGGSSAADNVAIGSQSLQVSSVGQGNVAIGVNTLLSYNNDTNPNTAIGAGALMTQTTGGFNTALGYNSLHQTQTGTFNIGIGYESGGLLTSSESHNIMIGNVGVAADNHTIRIGTQGNLDGQQNKTFIAGINGVNLTGNLVNISSTGQLAEVPNTYIAFDGTGNRVLSSNSTVHSFVTTTVNNVTGDGTVVNPVIFPTESLDQNSNYNPATGIFTAPVTGNYLISSTVTFSNLSSSHSSGQIAIVSGSSSYRELFNPGAARDSNNAFTANITQIVRISAAGTAQISVSVSGSTLTAGILGDATNQVSTFNVCLIS